MVNNIKKINEILQFRSEDDFYHVQILKRKKEHPELGSNSVAIKTYYVRSFDYLDYKYPEMINLAEFHNARVCINLNRRSFEKVGFQVLRKVADQIMNKDFKSIRKVYESVCGAHSSEPDKKWIIDIDRKDDYAHGIWLQERINRISPGIGEDKVYCILDTKNGYHLITKPFNIQEANSFLTVDVHKDNPTILYIP